MNLDNPHLRYWYNPEPGKLGETVEQFLQNLAGPTLIHIAGKDRQRKRAISTLLHGNEPSGTRALFRWLKQKPEPAVDILCIFGSVKTALVSPVFFYRQLPGEGDLNRCFKEPYISKQGLLAKAILDTLVHHQPEALIDIHNTSGMGPSFSVAIRQDKQHEALTSLFTERMLITELRLGALFEFSERNVPTVTIECGGSQDPRADQIAYDGILRYVNENQVLRPPDTDWELEVLHEPVRLELEPGTEICYREAMDERADITLPPDVERHNFGRINTNDLLGWVNPNSWHKLKLHTSSGENIKQEYLKLDGNGLYPAQPLKLFMITTNPLIAKSDCVFYAVKDEE